MISKSNKMNLLMESTQGLHDNVRNNIVNNNDNK